ncbi:ATP-dependent translocase ABCB1-like [Petromyzon marinus]|uniref:ATP-dependent translocase ABCB1-like n=1 Tax=Petromyzon marinus TaxID=7757 RepID=UPI003F6EAECB
MHSGHPMQTTLLAAQPLFSFAYPWRPGAHSGLILVIGSLPGVVHQGIFIISHHHHHLPVINLTAGLKASSQSRHAQRVHNVVTMLTCTLLCTVSMYASYRLQDDKKKDSSKKTSQPVKPLDLFRFADRWDIFLMVVGTLSAVGHGVTYPILFMVFGDMTSSFVDFGKVDQCQGNFSCIGNILANVTFDIEDKMTEYAYSFMGGGAAVMVLGTVQVACWAAAGARQAHRVRRLLFRSILRQDAAWFDSSQAGELGNCLTE